MIWDSEGFWGFLWKQKCPFKWYPETPLNAGKRVKKIIPLFQLANKKEKSYQEQIEALTKTNHILYYTLEKEKEERTDLQEMMDILNLNYLSYKDQSVGKERDAEQRVEKISYDNKKLTDINESLEKKCSELKVLIYWV